MNELALFAGAGGGILAGKELGWRTLCAVERDAYAAFILAQRQNDGLLPPFPIWSDIETFDGRQWRGRIDVISGGFPCQDISSAGKGAGITGKRSGLWKEMYRIVCEVRPRYVFVENSPMLTSRGLGIVLGDLAEAGYDSKWTCLSAAQVGANHERNRIWILAYPTSQQSNGGTLYKKHCETSFLQPRDRSSKISHTNGKPIRLATIETKQQTKAKLISDSQTLSNTDRTHGKRNQRPKRSQEKRTELIEHCGWDTEPNVGRVANGVAFRVDRLKAIGNGQVPQCAAEAWHLLIEKINTHS